MRRLHPLPPLLCLAHALGCVGADDAGDGKGGGAEDGTAEDGATDDGTAEDGAGDATGDGAGTDGTDGADGASPPDCLEAPLDCDLADNDCDGAIDEGGEEELRVWSGTDRDRDGWAVGAVTRACPEPATDEGLLGGGDCNDLDRLVHPGAAEDCLGAGDEDCDALDDCDDPDCASRPCVEDCDNGLEDDGDGRADCEDDDCYGPACPEVCDDLVDNDANGEADCADAACADPACPEACADRVDNDLDGFTDCADSACWGARCAEDCRDSAHADEDADGLANCEDAECGRWCVERCDLGDGDEDGLVGCDDPDCTFTLGCWEGVTVAAEGLRLRREVAWGSTRSGVPVVRRASRAYADQLALSGVVPTSAGGSADCWFTATGLSLSARRTDELGGAESITLSRSGGASSVAVAPAPCPALMLRDLELLFPDRPASTLSTWALGTGDLVPIGWVNPDRAGRDLYLAVTITAVTPYTTGPGPSGRWLRAADQSAWGALSVEVP